MKTHCSYCGKELDRKLSQFKKAKKHFCNKDHFYKYRREYNYHPVNKGKISYMKLITLAKQRKEKMLGNE